MFAVIILGASCTASTGSSSDPASTMAASTTSAASGSSAPDGGILDEDALEEILPTAAEVGAGYRLDDSDDVGDADDADDDGMFGDDAVDEACPALAELMGTTEEDDAPQADRSFVDDRDRNLAVSLTADISSSQVPTPERLDEVLAGVEECGPIPVDFDGLDGTVEVQALRDDSLGDHGMAMMVRMRADDAQLPVPIEIEFIVRLFVVGNLGGSVASIGSLDERTLEPIPVDTATVDRVAELVADRMAGVAGA